MELGASAVDNYDGDITASIVIDATAVNTAIVGSYPVTYDVSDSNGNPAVQVIRTVDVVDTTVPVITPVGPNPQTIEAGSAYVELGATAFDVGDGDITASIVIDATAVNTSIVASYPVTYDVSDSNGNPAAQVVRTVDVVDTTVPVITLLGVNPQVTEVGSAYVELGATASDNYDGDLTASIVLDSSAVDTAGVGSYVVTYDVSDSNGNPATQVIRTFDVVLGNQPPNTVPAAADDSYDVKHGGTLSVGRPGLLANDADPDGDALTVRLIQLPSFGSLSLDDDGSFVYVSDDNPFETLDTFVYEAVDSEGAYARAVVTINVTNAAPEAAIDEITIDEDSSTLIDPLANDFDPDGDLLAIGDGLSASLGTVSRSGDRALRLEPPADYNGLIEITYTAVDGFGGVNSGLILVTVLPIDDDPVPSGDHVELTDYEPRIIDALTNDIDVDGDLLLIVELSTPEHGSVRITNGGTIEYRPEPGYVGTDTFDYAITDGSGSSQWATVVIAVTEAAYAAGAELAASLGIDVVGLETQDEPFTDFSLGSLLSLQAVTLLVGAFWQSLGELRLPLTLLFSTAGVVLVLGRFTNAPVLFGLRRRPSYAAVLLDRESQLLVHRKANSASEILAVFAPTERSLISAGNPKTSNGIRWVPIAPDGERGWALADHLTLERSLDAFLKDDRPSRMVKRFAARLQSGADVRRMISPRGFIVASQSGIERIRRADVSGAATGLSDVRSTLRSFATAVDATADLSTRIRHSSNALLPIGCRNFLYLSIRPDDHGERWVVFFEYVGRRLYIVGISKDV